MAVSVNLFLLELVYSAYCVCGGGAIVRLLAFVLSGRGEPTVTLQPYLLVSCMNELQDISR